ncbi:MAG: GNAT family N-acetyltransferase [Ruminococcaceae bacterium]|nr:GNAT family N-acetyltransferase [Oscillospiraceae bacterium]
MIADKRLKLIKSENGMNYYLFQPSLFSLYYNDKGFRHEEEPPHRFSLSHKLHMMWYLLSVRGGYSILYLEKDGEMISYIVFVKANNRIIRNCEKNDYYTIFLWTYPEHRGKGIATLMSRAMLQDLQLNYKHFYKTINKDNVSSIRVAEKCGFSVESECVKTKLLHTIQRVPNGTQLLYSYSAK